MSRPQRYVLWLNIIKRKWIDLKYIWPMYSWLINIVWNIGRVYQYFPTQLIVRVVNCTITSKVISINHTPLQTAQIITSPVFIEANRKYKSHSQCFVIHKNTIWLNKTIHLLYLALATTAGWPFHNLIHSLAATK